MKLSTIVDLLGLPLPKDFLDVAVTGFSFDTRQLMRGNVFVAIVGEASDGHDYLQEAAKKGAVAAIVSKTMCEADGFPAFAGNDGKLAGNDGKFVGNDGKLVGNDAKSTGNDGDVLQCGGDFLENNGRMFLLCVDDTTKAFGECAAKWRDQFTLPVLALTGSVGKTTTKNILASICKAAVGEAHVLAPMKSYNNCWGVPYTLLQLNDKHRYAILELGMNHVGEIHDLSSMVKPTAAMITLIASVHAEGVGGVDQIAKAKAEIFDGLAPGGTVVLNRDDPYFEYFCDIAPTDSILTFGQSVESDVHLVKNERGHLTIDTPNGIVSCYLPLLGKHNALNALAATAAAVALDLEPQAIATGIEAVAPEKGRLQLLTLHNGATLLDDTYNAAPVSIKAALEVLKTFPGKKVFVMGDMKELGPDEKAIHRALANDIKQANVSAFFALGELVKETLSAFGEGAEHFESHAALSQTLKPMVDNETVILVKGSRAMRMEKIVEALINDN